MVMARIFFDFDGTLINSQKRLYELFRELCPECTMSYEEYWSVKRGGVSQKSILQKYYGYDDDRVRKFHDLWLARVEEPARVDGDTPVPGMEAVLRSCARRHRLCLVSSRQNRELAENELERLGWQPHFSAVLITEQKRTKEQLIRNYCSVMPEDVLVGDTLEDIGTAKALGIKSIAVSWGILDHRILVDGNPDMVLDEVPELLTCGLL